MHLVFKKIFLRVRKNVVTVLDSPAIVEFRHFFPCVCGGEGGGWFLSLRWGNWTFWTLKSSKSQILKGDGPLMLWVMGLLPLSLGIQHCLSLTNYENMEKKKFSLLVHIKCYSELCRKESFIYRVLIKPLCSKTP